MARVANRMTCTVAPEAYQKGLQARECYVSRPFVMDLSLTLTQKRHSCKRQLTTVAVLLPKSRMIPLQMRPGLTSRYDQLLRTLQTFATRYCNDGEQMSLTSCQSCFRYVSNFLVTGSFVYQQGRTRIRTQAQGSRLRDSIVSYMLLG